MKFISSILLEIKIVLKDVMKEEERELIDITDIEHFKQSILWGNNRYYDRAFIELFGIIEQPLSYEAKELLSEEFGIDLAW